MIYTRNLDTAQVADWVLEEIQLVANTGWVEEADCYTVALKAVAEELQVDPSDLGVELQKHWAREAYEKHCEY